MKNEIFKAGLVGSGYISKFHIEALKRLNRVDFVGVCDKDPLRSAQLAEEHKVKNYQNLESMREDGIDCIHILTPPDTHAQIALEALELGCHLYIEKPLATNVHDCQMIQEKAQEKGLSVCVGHSLLYDPQVKSILDNIAKGKLGRLISVDILRSSVYPPYSGGQLPPQYREGGYPFRDLGIHALYIFQAILGEIEDVEARWESLGGDTNLAFDEWRALVRCRNGLGQFQLSWNVKPLQNQIIVQGTKGVLRSDLFLMMNGLRTSMPVPKPAERIINAATDLGPSLVQVPLNAIRFIRGKILQYHGLQTLVGEFYRALENGQPMPVSITDAIPVVKWTEHVAMAADRDKVSELSTQQVSEHVPILVTGATGALGSAVVERLLAEGHKVRIFCRRKPKDISPDVEVVIGDLGNPEAVDRAVRGAEKVIHAGAAMKGGWIEHQCGTVTGTKNVLDACLKHNVSKLVHISSLSVVDWAGSSRKKPISEGTRLEPRPSVRGSYTRAKLEAEILVSKYCRDHNLPTVILRPGQIFGGRIPLMTPAVARKLGTRRLVLGDGKLKLPLIYIDDVVEAILLGLNSDLASGEIIHIHDNVSLTQDQVLQSLRDGDSKIVHFPRWIIFSLAAAFDLISKIIRKKLPISIYRFRSALARLEFQSDRAESLLGWKPQVGVYEGIKREVGQQPTPASFAQSSPGRHLDGRQCKAS